VVFSFIPFFCSFLIADIGFLYSANNSMKMPRLISLFSIFLSIGLSSAFVGPSALRNSAVVVRPSATAVVYPQSRLETSLDSSRVASRIARSKIPVQESSGFTSKILACARSCVCLIKPCILGKYIGLVESVGGLVAFLRADVVADFLGLKSTTSSKLHLQTKGMLSMGAGITTVLTVVQGMAPLQAFGYGMIPSVVGLLAQEISGDMVSEWDMPKNVLAGGAVLMSAAVYGCLTAATWATPVMKLLAAAMVLEGLAVSCTPSNYLGRWYSNKHLDDGDNKFAARVAGVTETHFGILASALAMGMSATRALGYSMIPYFLLTWWALYSDTTKNLSLNKGAIGTSAVVVPLATAALLL
jgi:hypothetical protein